MGIDKNFPINIRPETYEYPLDRSKRDQLNSYRDLKKMSKEFINNSAEPWLNALLTGTCIKINRLQLPDLFKKVEELSNILDVPCPQVFIQQDPYLNSYTLGTKHQSFLVITHSLYESLEEEELSFIIGHEIGHIKSDHVIYTTLMRYLIDQQSFWNKNRQEKLIKEMLEWQRMAEITADRAGLLVCQDIDIACNSLLILAVGSRKLVQKININNYVDEQLLSLQYNTAAPEIQSMQTHPFIPLRIKEIRAFFYSDNYKSLMKDSVKIDNRIDDLNDIEIELE